MINCRLCKAEIKFGILCNQCYIDRKQALTCKLQGENLGLLDHHGAIVDPQSLHKFTETDTIDEFAGVIVKKKLEFGCRATAEKCGNISRLKDCAETIKTHLKDNFSKWLLLGYPLDKDDPLLLSVRVNDKKGNKVLEAATTFSFSGLFLHQSMDEKINLELFALPSLMEKVAPALRNYRTVVIHLLWWATLSEQKHEDFIKELQTRIIEGRDIETGKDLLLETLNAKTVH